MGRWCWSGVVGEWQGWGVLSALEIAATVSLGCYRIISRIIILMNHTLNHMRWWQKNTRR